MLSPVPTPIEIEKSNRSQIKVSKAPVKILLAEDDEDLRAFMTRSLEASGFEVRAVPNGFELVNVLSDWILGTQEIPPADILVTDVRMPGFDGLSVVESMCVSDWKIPTIVVSAVPRADLRLGSVEEKNVVFLPKPVKVPELVRCVRMLTHA